MNVDASVAAFALFLITLGVLALAIGVHDAALADASFGVTASAVFLIALALVLLVSAVQLAMLSRRRHWPERKRPPCKATVLIAFLLVIVVSVYVFFAAIRGSGGQRAIVVAISLALIAGAPLGLRFFGSEARVTLPRLGTIALGLVGTTLAAWQFWYQNEIAPAQVGRAVALDAELRLAGERRLDDVVRATASFQAITGESVVVVGSAYTLTGSRLVRCDRRERVDAATVANFFRGFLADPQRSRFMADVREQQPATVLAAGKFIGDGRRLESKVPYTREFVFVVPRRRYQLLRFRAQLFAIPASLQLSQHARPQYTLAGDNYVYGLWHVDDNSWLRDLIYGRERWVLIRYELVNEPGRPKASPDMRVTAKLTDPAWTHAANHRRRAAALRPPTINTDPNRAVRSQ